MSWRRFGRGSWTEIINGLYLCKRNGDRKDAHGVRLLLDEADELLPSLQRQPESMHE